MSHVNNCQLLEISPRHEAIVEHLLAYPEQSQREVACHFGVSPQFMGLLIHNDLFQAHLRQRREELFASTTAPLARKLEALAHLSIERLTDAVADSADPEFLRKSADTILNRMGLGAKAQLIPISVGEARAQPDTSASRAAIEAGVRARHLLARAEEKMQAEEAVYSEVDEQDLSRGA